MMKSKGRIMVREKSRKKLMMSNTITPSGVENSTMYTHSYPHDTNTKKNSTLVWTLQKTRQLDEKMLEIIWEPADWKLNHIKRVQEGFANATTTSDGQEECNFFTKDQLEALKRNLEPPPLNNLQAWWSMKVIYLLLLSEIEELDQGLFILELRTTWPKTSQCI